MEMLKFESDSFLTTLHRLYVDSALYKSPQQSTLSSHKSYDCSSLVFTTLSALNGYLRKRVDNWNGVCLTLTNTVYEDLMTNADSVPTFDKILKTNKAAVNNMDGLLRCTCAQNPHLAMFYASLIKQILC